MTSLKLFPEMLASMKVRDSSRRLLLFEITPLTASHQSDSRLGYYIREGKHSMTSDDWEMFMNFADRHFGAKR